MRYEKREEIPANRKWDLTHIIKDLNEWDELLESAKEKALELEMELSNSTKSANNLYGYLISSKELGKIEARIFGYSFLLQDEDTKNQKSQELEGKITGHQLKRQEMNARIRNAIMEMGEEKFNKYKKENPKLEIYTRQFDELFRYKSHTLTEKEELLLSQTVLLSNASGIYSKITDTDMVFPNIKDEKGKEIKLTEGNYGELIRSENREVRKQTNEALFSTYKKYENTLASTYQASLKEDFFYAKTQNYESTLENALFGDEIPVEVYTNLIKSVRNNVKPMEEYLELKKEKLGLRELHMYDLSVPMENGLSEKITYEEAYETMKDALSVLGERYIEDLEKAYEGGWIDVYESDSKASGAYSHGGQTEAHPYVLLNHKDDMDSMFTLAHEMGHALHSHYSNKANPDLYANYSLFVAEVASTVNEVLLLKHLLKKSKNVEVKKSLLNEYMEQFKSTMYRQTMFAEFEKIAHEKTQNNEPLTAEILNGVYEQLVIDYQGDGVVLSEFDSSGWSRIPHFYRAFYVYQYATGYAAANALAKQILEEGQPAVDRYLKFLSSGSTKNPIELLKDAGVDMSTSKPVEDAMDIFKGLLKEYKSL